MNRVFFFFMMLVFMVMFSVLFILLKTFVEIDITWGQVMMPVWIGIPVISLVRFIFHIMYERL